MAVKKKRSVEELEQLLKDSERIRKDHLDVRREQLHNLRRERGSRFRKFTMMMTPRELDEMVTQTILRDSHLVNKAVEDCAEAIKSGNWYGGIGRQRAARGVFAARPADEESIRYKFKHIYDDINRYTHVFGALTQFFIEPILNRSATVDAIGREDCARMRRVYYSYNHDHETYFEDLERVRQVLNQDSIEQLVVRQRVTNARNNTDLVYQLEAASGFLESVQKNLISVMTDSSVAKDEQIMSANSKINW